MTSNNIIIRVPMRTTCWFVTRRWRLSISNGKAVTGSSRCFMRYHAGHAYTPTKFLGIHFFNSGLAFYNTVKRRLHGYYHNV